MSRTAREHRMPAPIQDGLCVLFALGSVLAAGTAFAHGRPPYVERIAFDPSDPNRLVLQTSFGLAVSTDEGGAWRWVCAAAYRVDPTIEDPDVAFASDGALLVGGISGLGRVDRAFCDWTFPPGPAQDAFIVDIDRDPATPTTMWAVSSSGSESDSLLRSDDDGAEWERVGEPIDEILVERMARAPSDAARIYLTGAIPAGAEERRGFLLRSDDGGASFERMEIPLLEGERFPLIEAVDPTDPDRIFLRVSRRAVDLRPSRLLYDDDAGGSLETVLELQQLRAVAVSDDGRTVWAGSSNGGGVLVARDGMLAFEPINDLDVRCLAARGDELWLCVDQHREGFGLGVSTDDGATVEPRFWLDRVSELPECDRCSTTGFVCPAWAPDLAYDQSRYFSGGDDAGVPTTGIPRDAGDLSLCSVDGSTTVAEPGEGCGCRAAASGTRPAHWLLLPAMVAVAWRRRRRLRSRRIGRSPWP